MILYIMFTLCKGPLHYVGMAVDHTNYICSPLLLKCIQFSSYDWYQVADNLHLQIECAAPKSKETLLNCNG